MKKIFLKVGIQALIFFVLLELGLMTLSNLEYIRIDKPSYNFKRVEHFWSYPDSVFGSWRRPYQEYFHLSSCFSVNYKANSIGARDIERNPESSKNRIMVIGDSFAAGWGVDLEERFSNQLENICQLEFLNMGISNFGLTQEYVLYKNKAKKYDHSSILWTIFPENDIIDDDPKFWISIDSDSYRPFWKGEYPNYKLVYGPNIFIERTQGLEQSKSLKILLKNFTYTYNFLKYIKFRYIEYTSFPRGSYLGHNGYYKLNEDQWNRIKYNIEQVLIESEGKSLNMVTIPSKFDIIKYKEKEQKVPLRDSLEKLSFRLGFSYYDLLREFDKNASLSESELYFDCDDHWNEKGHRWAAKVLDSVFSFRKKTQTRE